MAFHSGINDDFHKGNDAIEEKARRKRVGRKGPDGQEQVIEMQEVRDKITTLVDLYKLHEDCGKDLNAGIKAVAESSGLLASAIRKLVIARAGDNFEAKAREIEQLALVFEEVGNE